MRLGSRAVPYDRRDGQELADRATLRRALDGCDGVVHLAALHPLVAGDAPPSAYRAANVEPLFGLIEESARARIRRIVFASSTSVWRDSPPGTPARFLSESSAPDATDAYATSKLACERMLEDSGLRVVTLRLARFARAGVAEDDVRKLYRAVDPRDAALAVVLALDAADPAALYAIAAPTPFTPSDAAMLDADPHRAIVERTGREPAWLPPRIGSVVVAARAQRELAWSCAYPSSLDRRADAF